MRFGGEVGRDGEREKREKRKRVRWCGMVYLDRED